MGLLHVPFWSTLVHLRVQVLQIEDVSALYQQGLTCVLYFVACLFGSSMAAYDELCIRTLLEASARSFGMFHPFIFLHHDFHRLNSSVHYISCGFSPEIPHSSIQNHILALSPLPGHLRVRFPSLCYGGTRYICLSDEPYPAKRNWLSGDGSECDVTDVESQVMR